MDQQQFWDMLHNGQLTKIARDDFPMFDKLCEEIIANAINDSGIHRSSVQDMSDRLTLALLWDSRSLDERISLAEQYPEVFLRQRIRILEAHRHVFCDEDNDEQAVRLQWRIDRERERHQNPLGACVALNRMMNESMWGENGLHDVLNRFVYGLPKQTEKETLATNQSSPSDNVLSFKPKNG